MRALVLLLFLHFSVFSIGQSLNLASDSWPPFTDKAGNTAVAMELVEEALGREKISVTYEVADFKVVLEGLQEGSFDGSAALWYSDERSTYLSYSQPYLENQLVLVGLKGSDVSQQSLSELKDKRVAIVATYDYGEALDTVSGVEWVTSSSDQESLELLFKAETDYMLADALLAEHLIQDQEAEVAEFLEIGEHTLLRRSLYFAVQRSNPQAEEILDKFNKRIREMMADGSYNEILQLNWIQMDVDGDGRIEWVSQSKEAGEEAPEDAYSLDSDLSANSDARYLIDGKVYDNWEQVPEEFKKSPSLNKQDYNREGFGLKFNF